MALYQVQVKFRHPSVKDGVWLTVARASKHEEALQYVAMWQRSSEEARNIAGVRVMNAGKEVRL